MNVIVVAGALLGAAGVALGAFGAHALRDTLGPGGAETWRTAVQYHLVHAVAMVAVGGLRRRDLTGDGAARPGDDPAGVAAGASFGVGIVMFSGSLYALALGGPGWLGPVTPIGGALFIVGWLALAREAWRR